MKIGKYSVLSELGEGASAVVYLGEDPFNDRKVAVKVAKRDLEMGEEEAKRFEKLFLNEASLAGKLNHPNIVGVFDAVVEGDQRLFNQYGVMLVNSQKHPHVKKEWGQAFVDWLISPEGQKAIADFKIEGRQLFFPNASSPGA